MGDFISAKVSTDNEVDLSRFEAIIREKVLFSGAATMASFIANEARAKAPSSSAEHYFYSSTGAKYLFQPGTLKKNIYWAHASDKETVNRKTYRISWNHREVPYGYMVEFGTSRAAAHPFLRPAFGRIHEAIAMAKSRMAQRLAEET